MDTINCDLVCKKEFCQGDFNIEIGIIYNTWYLSNLHITQIIYDHINNACCSFSVNKNKNEYYIWDYFYTIEENRDIKLKSLLK